MDGIRSTGETIFCDARNADSEASKLRRLDRRRQAGEIDHFHPLNRGTRVGDDNHVADSS